MSTRSFSLHAVARSGVDTETIRAIGTVPAELECDLCIPLAERTRYFRDQVAPFACAGILKERLIKSLFKDTDQWNRKCIWKCPACVALDEVLLNADHMLHLPKPYTPGDRIARGVYQLIHLQKKILLEHVLTECSDILYPHFVNY
jgi:hypothetical protein